MTTQEIINPKMLEDLGFTRRDIGNDEVWQHRELDVRNLLLHDFDGAYHFILRGSIQGLGTMRTFDELIDGFEFITSGHKLLE